MNRRMTILTAAAFAAAWLIGVTEARAVWIPPKYLSQTVDGCGGGFNGKTLYRPRNAAGTLARWKLKAVTGCCPVTDGIPVSLDELICILEVPLVFAGPFGSARVIAFTEVGAGGVIAFSHVGPTHVIPPPAIANATGGACYPWDGGAYIGALGADPSLVPGVGTNGQLLALDFSPPPPLTAVPATPPCLYF
jgi:hypothetical protein